MTLLTVFPVSDFVLVVPVVPVVSFRLFQRFRFGVSGFSTCLFAGIEIFLQRII